jgi:hypothetical protein
LLISGGGESEAAKLCKFGWNNAFSNTYATNLADGSWALGNPGANCCTQGQSNDNNSNCYTTGTYSGSGAPSSAFCNSVAIGGIAGYGRAPDGLGWTYEVISLFSPTRGAGDGGCYCKLTYPIESSWVYISSNAGTYCAKACAQMIQHPNSYKSSLLDLLTATIGWGQ